MQVTKSALLSAVGAGALIWALVNGTAAAATAATPAAESTVDEVVVTGSRLPPNLEAFPGAVSVVNSEKIEQIRAVTTDLSAILALTVPGFGAPDPGSRSNLEQTMRGRKPAVFIDGVPVGEPNRDAGTDLRLIDSSAVGNVEVLRGSSSLYGQGGAGGIINYITAVPKPGPAQFSTEVGMGVSLTHPGGSLQPSILQTASLRAGPFDFIGTASYEHDDKVYDAHGRQISDSYQGPGGITDTETVNLFGTVGYNWDGGERLAVTGLYFDATTGLAFHRVQGDPAHGVLASAAPGPADPRARNTGQSNAIVNVVYTGLTVLGTSVRLQGFHQDYEQTFDFDPKFGGSQSQIISNKSGGRLDLITPLWGWFQGGRVLWGVDYLHDNAKQSLVDGRVWIPPMDEKDLAEFAQVELPIGDRLSVQGGFRHQSSDISVPTFTTLVNVAPTFRGATIQGGTLSFDTTVFNAGASYRLLDGLTAYYAYSQGFNLADIGLVLRAATNPTIITNPANQPKAQIIDNHEVGLKYRADNFSGSMALFQSTSDLGSSYILVNSVLQVQRLPERVRGIEIEGNYRFSDSIEVGGTFTYNVGRQNSHPATQGGYDTYLSTQRIPPPLVNLYVQKVFAQNWTVRLQGVYSGHEDRFPGQETIYGKNEQHSYTTFQLTASGRVGPGRLSIGIHNLLNADYFPLLSQIETNQAPGQIFNYSKAQGAFATIRYRIEY